MIVVTANLGLLPSEAYITDKKVGFTRPRKMKIGLERQERSPQIGLLNAYDYQ